MRVHLLLVVLVCGFASRAGAAPILYDFTATMTVTKWSLSGTITPDEEAYWFPTLQNGATYAAQGRLSYDIDNPQAWLTIGDYTWNVANNLGIVATSGSLSFIDSFPTITRGLPCVTPPATGDLCYFPNGDDFYGRDGYATVYGQNGNFTGGTMTIWGTGDTRMPSGAIRTTAIAWQGTIGNVTRVPEPATALLLALGAGFALRRRRLSSSTQSAADRGSQA